jgi:hypothetical protein
MMSTVKSITKSTVKSNVYLTKIAENGYLEPTAVGATVGALTGGLVGGSLGISGGEMSLDTQKALNNIKADINRATNKIPLLKPNLMEIAPVSRGEHLASGILKGMKYGAMAGIPLGGALFAYDNYRSNQEKKASVVNHLAHHAIDINLEQPPMNPYLQRVSDMQKEAETQTEGYLPTFIQDTRGGMIGGGLIGGLLGTPRVVSEVSALRKAGTGLNRLQYVSRPLSLIAASGLLGGAAGAAASVPHYLFKQAGVAEDQARAKIHEDNAVIRPYHIAMTPEMNQAVESLAVGTGTHLAAKALGHVHPGFAAAAPGLGVAAGLLDATRLGDKLKADDAEKVRRYSAYIRNQAREDALKKEASTNPYLLKLAEQAESVPHDWKPALSAGAIDAGMGLGLGALGHHVSKKYFGGKYAPLIIGGTEGLAAMTATDLYQRKHERELAELKKGS